MTRGSALGRHHPRRLGAAAVTVAELVARALAEGRPVRLAWGEWPVDAADDNDFATAVLPTVNDDRES